MIISTALPESLPLSWKTFLIAGQSNAEGRGFTADLTGAEFPRSGRTRMRVSNAWVAGAEPTYPGAGVGFGMAFANALAGLLPNVGINLVNGAYGGSSISQWQKSALRSSLYGGLLNRARLVLSEGGTIDGMAFYQGETEAQTSLVAAQAWDENFLLFVSDFRADLGVSIPVVFVSLCDNPSLASAPYWDDVTASQEGIVLTGLNMARVSAEGLAFRTDDPEQKVHLATAGQLTLGADRIAPAMLDLL
ncbi:sialate O-acetylesterase [Devosia sp. J2-20]|uniref:sialate O-acetylesterase n=1 Tax=Devosia sp. J2-20 TaxID=3026161 RepID=UPI00249A7EA0|nr:sialate O-acetylesterase [Devosia sp. J2-20]WDR00762.1 sialate O-acetylesterase [Devosia sp. J2-20]